MIEDVEDAPGIVQTSELPHLGRTNRAPWATPLKKLNWGLVALLLFSALLMVGWSLAVPVFEGPDENAHWQYARYLHQFGELPPYTYKIPEGNSPPLYYLLLAPLAVPSAQPPTAAIPYSRGVYLPFDPRYFHNTDNDFGRYWPIRFARLVSILISLTTILFSYLAGKEATGQKTTGLLAAGLVALLPQFTFRAMNVTNDVLLTACCAATTYLIIRLIRRGFSWRLGLITAAVIAGGYLSKISAVFLPVPFGLAVLTEAPAILTTVAASKFGRWRRDWPVHLPWPTLAKRLSVLGLTLALVAPWSIRNLVLYGDFFANGAMLTAVSFLVHKKPFFSSYFTTTFPDLLYRSFIGVFGWMNLFLPGWIYLLFGVIGLFGLVGYIWRWWQGRIDTRFSLIMLTIPFLALLVVININLTFDQPQGRYLFPALAAIMVLLAVGLEGWPFWRNRARIVTAVSVGLLAGLNVFILTTIVIPAYWPGVTRDLSSVVTHVQPTNFEGLARSEVDAIFTINSGDPHIYLDSAFDSANYNFAQFIIKGSKADASPEEVTGGLYFALDNGDFSEKRLISFTWKTDGEPHLITVAVGVHPAWKSRLTGLRLDPVDLKVRKYQGLQFQISQFALYNNLEPFPEDFGR